MEEKVIISAENYKRLVIDCEHWKRRYNNIRNNLINALTENIVFRYSNENCFYYSIPQLLARDDFELAEKLIGREELIYEIKEIREQYLNEQKMIKDSDEPFDDLDSEKEEKDNA